MSEKNTRELVSWRIGKLPDSEQLNKWVNAQSNVQNSITSLVRHMIEQFGYRDITAHDIQKSLFQKPITDELRLILSEFKTALPTEEAATSETSNKLETKPEKKTNNDDIYRLIDPNSF
ncbi:hypothetical protein ABNF65_12665 [Paenibacillus larvae]